MSFSSPDILTGSTVPIASGGTALSTTPTNGKLLIGNGTGYTLANITAGANITVNNSSGAIEIVASSGFSTTEYNDPAGNPYTYNIPTGAVGLRLVLCGGGGSGGSSATNAGAGGGGAGLVRYCDIPVDGATTMSCTVGEGGIASNSANTAGTAGGTTSVTINSKTIYCYGGGAGGQGVNGAGTSGGGSAGSGSAGGNAGPSYSTVGTAGSNTASGAYAISCSGVAGAPGTTSTANGNNGLSGGATLTSNLYIIGGSGGSGCKTDYQGGQGGQSQGGFYPGNTATSGNTSVSCGGCGGSSGLAIGGQALAGQVGQNGSFGSGGAGGGSNSGSFRAGGQGGHGLIRISPY